MGASTSEREKAHSGAQEGLNRAAMEMQATTCKYCGNQTPAAGVFCCWCGERIARKKREKKAGRTWAKPRARQDGSVYGRIMIGGERIVVEGQNAADYYAKCDAIAAGILERSEPDRRIVADCIAEYIRQREGIRSPSTIDGYIRKAKSNLQELMPLRVGQITRERVQAAVTADVADGYSGKTIKEALALVGAATGVRYEGLVMPSTRPNKKPPVYSTEDLRKLLQALAEIGGDVECAGLLAAWLSLRRSEIKGLRWGDVGEDSITVRTALVYDKHHKLTEKGTKNETSERRLPCDPYILEKLAALPGEHAAGDFVIAQSTAGLWEGITRACKRAGIEHGYLHGLRHTNASIMELLGIPSTYANRRGGWASDHVRRGTYVDAMSEGEREAAEKVDSLFRELLPKNYPDSEKV